MSATRYRWDRDQEEDPDGGLVSLGDYIELEQENEGLRSYLAQATQDAREMARIVAIYVEVPALMDKAQAVLDRWPEENQP